MPVLGGERPLLEPGIHGTEPILAPLRAFWRTQVEPWERWWLGVAMLATTLLVFAYVLGIDHALAGDEIDYHRDAALWADGSWFHSLAGPFPDARPSAWKAPLYPIWLGGIYDLIGLEVRGAVLIQGLLLAPLTVLLTWLLARRLLGATRRGTRAP